MATMSRDVLLQCDGFCVDGEGGPIGWVEETWLGPAGEAAALAVRTIDGRDGLLLVEDVDAARYENEVVLIRSEGRLLELDVPRLESTGKDSALTASWRTTGEVLDPPLPPGMFRHALLALRPWRLAPAPWPSQSRAYWPLHRDQRLHR